MEKTRQHYEGIEILRALACFMVVILHCIPPFAGEMPGEGEAPFLFFLAVARSAVPLFFMITGYLLLDRDEEIFQFYKKRMLKIAAPVVFYSLFYTVMGALASNEPLTLRLLLISPFRPILHLWFMYHLLGAYIFMPFLRRMFVNATDRERMVFTAIWALLFLIVPAFLPTVDVGAIQKHYGLNQFAGFIGFVFIGGCLKNIPSVNPRNYFAGYVLSGILMVIFTFLYTAWMGKKGFAFVGNRSPFAFTAAVCLFMAIKELPLVRWKGTITEIAKYSFGIYLVHMLYVRVVLSIGIYDAIPSSWLAIPVCAVIVLILSFLTIKYAKKVPYLRAVVG